MISAKEAKEGTIKKPPFNERLFIETRVKKAMSLGLAYVIIKQGISNEFITELNTLGYIVRTEKSYSELVPRDCTYVIEVSWRE